MKKFILMIGVLACMIPSVYAQDVNEVWVQANTQYSNGDYNGAAAAYESIVEQGYISSRLFYNLGNAYFKSNRLGRAILNYNKAFKLTPYDKDINYNLTVANSYVQDKIDTVPEIFLTRWMRAWRSSLGSNAWTWVSLGALALMLGGVLMFMLSERRGWRKAGFFAGVVFLVMFVCSTAFAALEKKDMVDASTGIVLVQAVSVKSSPDSAGNDLFILHEGTKVDVLSTYDGWMEIMIADGNKGWASGDAIGLIKY